MSILSVTIAASLALSAPGAQALTGDDGLIAIATAQGIEVLDSNGDGSDLHVLIQNGPAFFAQEPAWSPTGDQIAYVAWTDEGRSIMVARADGTHAHQVSLPSETAGAPSWSPDGRVAYSPSSGTVVIADPDGSHRTLVHPKEDLGRPGLNLTSHPTWTADGRLWVLLQDPGVMASSPFLADGDGTDFRPLTYPGGSTPDYSDLSSDWQFSSTGLVAYPVYEPGDDNSWVHFETFDGTYMDWPYADLPARTDVALAPSGQRAVRVWPGFHSDPYETGIGVTGVDLTQPEPFTPEFGFEVPGDVAGLDWQPRCSITGTPGDDVLVGTAGPDLICGLGGNDRIRGLDGNDVIYAGRGDDTIRAGEGNDVIVGGRGIDLIRGGPGRDLINSRRDAQASDTIDAAAGQHDVCLSDRADVVESCRVTH